MLRIWVCQYLTFVKHFIGSGNMASLYQQSLWKPFLFMYNRALLLTLVHGAPTTACLAWFQHYAFADTLSLSSWGSWLPLAVDRLLASSKHAHWRTQLDCRDHACDITWECTLIKMLAFVAISVFVATVVFVVWLGRHSIVDVFDMLFFFYR